MVIFSNGTEYSWFQDSMCARCIYQVDGEACDQVAIAAVTGETPAILRRVAPSAANPLGVECDAFSSTGAARP